ncbi:MAG: HEAT repeat domain-containing protein, partial [Limisphaerales bacterium]
TEQGALEALWMWQAIDQVNADLLKKNLAAKDGRIRAAATRVLSFWQNRIPNSLDLIAPLVADENGRVRVEAVRAAAKIPEARAAELVLSALDKPVDRFLEYAVWLSINDLAEPWVKAVQNGEWKLEGREKQLEFALRAVEPPHAGVVLSKVLADHPMPTDGSGPWIDLIAKAGSREHLDMLLEKTLKDFNDAAKIKALNALSDAAQNRQLVPSADKTRIQSLLTQNIELRTAVLRLAGKWKLRSFKDELTKSAGSPEMPPALRTVAFQSLREIGGDEIKEELAKLSSDTQKPVELRAEAALAFTTLDLQKGAPLAIEVLTATESEDAALKLWRGLLANKGAAGTFAQLLPKAGLPTPMVKAGLRAAREGGRNEPNLVLALARNIDEATEASNLSPQELERLLAFIKEKSDPARGEMIYRRQELACVSCHAIGGIGGKVGPDLTSIGASAPPDYLVESMIFPNRKVKEGYHSVILETKDEMEFSGILVRETDEQLIIRDATNREVEVPKNNVANKRIGGSLMPAGLIDALNEQEQGDLYRFLSELGKQGPYDASKGNVARVWQVIPRTLDVAQFPDDKVISMDKTTTISHNEWQPMATLVDGRLLKQDFEKLLKSVHYRDPDAVYAKARFEVPKSGRVRLQLPKLTKAIVWIDGKPIEAREEIALDLASGEHTLAVKLDAKALPEHLKVSTPDGTFVSN